MASFIFCNTFAFIPAESTPALFFARSYSTCAYLQKIKAKQ